ncbi:MAG: hypothetical protein OXN16_11920 [Gammaproteobacteria bacterium]|nr:hypothetical protein [Gammaproteobacteria bacterium]
MNTTREPKEHEKLLRGNAHDDRFEAERESHTGPSPSNLAVPDRFKNPSINNL